MHFKIILISSVFLVFLQVTSAALIEKHFYAIQNEMDKTYLKAIKNGKLCKRLGDVVTTKRLVRSSELYRWEFSKSFRKGQSWLRGPSGDELTMDDYPPFCYLVYAFYKLTPITKNTFTIESYKRKKCLTSAGLGKKITWKNCNKTRKQIWKFIDMGKKE